ncbi:MAG: hypothetical protein D6715_04350 [Calditrichaeota bacterium]|nr:MAG: hypothetical protein D6715_04350 [Calditrichota bacterium]
MALFARKSVPLRQEGEAPREYFIGGRHKVYFNSHGLIPVVLQDARTGRVLRLGYMDRWALEMSWEEKNIYLYRRSRGRLEKLGEEQQQEYPILSLYVDKSRRSLLVLTREPDGQNSSYERKIFEREQD